jgi:AcrR family transcriptional regulator
VTTPQKANARARLVAAAAAELWSNGYAATSPADIQRAAGAGQGSMYHHFSGKADLARAAIEHLAGELADGLDATFEAAAPGLPRVLAYLERERDPLRGCRVGRLTADPEVVGNPRLREPVQGSFAWLQGRLANELREAQDRGQIPGSLDPSAVAAAVTAVVQGGYVLARAEQDPAAFSRAIDGVRELLIHLQTSA